MVLSGNFIRFAVLSSTFALLAGCACPPPVASRIVEEEVPVYFSISDEVAEAIAFAKAARYRTNGIECEWEDTQVMIDEAEQQGLAGYDELAIETAEGAEDIALGAYEKCVELGAVDVQSTAYTVVPGDSLWGIAAMEDVYADPYQWPLIYRSNASKIKDPDLIYPGQVFDIEQGMTEADIDAAINHAKNRGAWSISHNEDSDRLYLNSN